MQAKTKDLADAFVGMQNQIPLDEINALNQAYQSGAIDEEEYREGLLAQIDVIQKIADSLPESELKTLFSSIAQGYRDMLEQADTAQEMKPNILSTEEVNTALGDLASMYQTLEKVIDEYNQSGYVSLDMLQSLLSMGGEYLQYLQFENGQMSINEEGIIALAEARIIDWKAKIMEQGASLIESFSDEAAAAAYLAGETNKLAEARASDAMARLMQANANMMDNGSETQKAATQKALQNTEQLIKTGDDFLASLRSNVKNVLGSKSAAAAGTDAYTESLKREKEALEAEKEALEASKSALEDKKAVYESALRAVNKALDGEIDRLQELGKAEKEALEGQLDDLERAHDAAVKIIDDQIKKLEDQQQAWDDYYQPMIDVIQEQIDALEKKNDEEERALKLQKAQDLSLIHI